MNKSALQYRALLTLFAFLLTLLNALSSLRGSHDLDGAAVDTEWPVKGLRPAAMTPEESVHYRIETDVGTAEWESSLPRGTGIVFHRPSRSVDEKAYRLTMFHQLSCLATLRRSLVNPTTPPNSETQFCLNYMRESLTCGADSHLEMVRSEYGGRAVLPYTTRTDCTDWERVWQASEANFDEWARTN